ncbi:hypothetical protein HPB51_026038 [Rhipicephalus microplus]|uniref:Nuclear pore complex protein Nup153 n=1 Tax=Rhipicephalus microplus TaxID=6941 RepID=A0A9J6EE06_RHIMP|nr:hypothetical protein HPB51_026038 [Rhipicephalus microplus]
MSLGSPPRSTRDCAVGPDGEPNEVAPSPSVPATLLPETPLQRPSERRQERPQEQPLERTLGRLFEQPSERYEQSPVPVVARGVKPGGATVGLSNTTRQILASLEKMATPVTVRCLLVLLVMLTLLKHQDNLGILLCISGRACIFHSRPATDEARSDGGVHNARGESEDCAGEAKRVPLRSRIADGRTWTLLHHRDPPAPTQGGPPVRSAARPSVRTIVPPRTEASRLEVARKESAAAESSWADSLKTKVLRADTGKPEVPSVDAPKQYPLRLTEAPSVETSSVTVAPTVKPNSVASAWEPPCSRSASDRAAGGGKMVRVIHSAHPAPLKMSGPPLESEEELPPPVPLPPIQKLPKFSFNLNPPQTQPVTTPTTITSNSSGKTSGGSISSGLVYQFSEPWGPRGDERQKEGTLSDKTDHSHKKPGEAILTKSEPNVSVPESKKSGDTRKPGNATAKNDKDSSSSTKGGGDLWARFKPAAGSWSCSECMITNPASASRCQACETLRPGSTPKPAAPAPTSVASTVPAPVAPPPASVAAGNLPPLGVRHVPGEERDQRNSLLCVRDSSVVSQQCYGRCCTFRGGQWVPLGVRHVPAAAAAFNFKLPSSESSGFGGAPFAAAPAQFKFGIPSSGTAKPSEAVPSVESAGKPFKFGITSTTTVTSAPSSTTAVAPMKDFKFGSSSEEPSKAINFGSSASEASKAFKFGSNTEEQATPFKFGTTTNEPATKSFKFGTTASERQTKSFTFGASSEEPTKKAKPNTTTEEAAKLFNFGSSSEQPSKPLKFGCTTDEQAKLPQTGSGSEASTKSFKFSASTDEPAKPSPVANSAEGASGGFKLGHMAEPSKEFTFGSTTVKEPAKPFAFGTTPSTETSTGGFKFGATAEDSTKSVRPGSSEEQQPPAKTFKFLNPSGPTEPSKLFQFGATVEPTPKLGATVDTPTKPFSFGTPATTAGAAETAPKQFLFGLAAKPSEMSAPPAAVQQPSVVHPGGSQTTTAGQLAGFLAPATTAHAAISLPAAAPTMEPAKPAFPSSQFVFGQKSDASAATFSFGSQPVSPAFPQPASGASTPLPSFGTLANKPPEPHVAAQQPAFGIGAYTHTCFWCPQPSQACCRTCSSTHGHQHDNFLEAGNCHKGFPCLFRLDDTLHAAEWTVAGISNALDGTEDDPLWDNEDTAGSDKKSCGDDTDASDALESE